MAMLNSQMVPHCGMSFVPYPVMSTMMNTRYVFRRQTLRLPGSPLRWIPMELPACCFRGGRYPACDLERKVYLWGLAEITYVSEICEKGSYLS